MLQLGVNYHSRLVWRRVYDGDNVILILPNHERFPNEFHDERNTTEIVLNNLINSGKLSPALTAKMQVFIDCKIITVTIDEADAVLTVLRSALGQYGYVLGADDVYFVTAKNNDQTTIDSLLVDEFIAIKLC